MCLKILTIIITYNRARFRGGVSWPKLFFYVKSGCDDGMEGVYGRIFVREMADGGLG